MRLRGTGALLVSLVSLNAFAQHASPPPASPTVQCFREARYGGLLNQDQATRLCSRVNSVAPARCYERARDSAQITQDQAIGLCQCALSNGPVDCYLQARQEALLNQDDALRLCINADHAPLYSAECKFAYGGYFGSYPAS